MTDSTAPGDLASWSGKTRVLVLVKPIKGVEEL